MGPTFIDGAYRAFEPVTLADLVGKEGYMVELTSAGKIQLYSGSSGVLPIGVLSQTMGPSGGWWTVRLLGKGGTVRMIASGAITIGTAVRVASGGLMAAASGAGMNQGVLVGDITPSASGDWIEVLDYPNYQAA